MTKILCTDTKRHFVHLIAASHDASCEIPYHRPLHTRRVCLRVSGEEEREARAAAAHIPTVHNGTVSMVQSNCNHTAYSFTPRETRCNRCMHALTL